MAGSDLRGMAAALAVVLLLTAGLVPAIPAGNPTTAHDDGESGAPQRAVERPDHNGPYVNGTTTERFRGSTKLYSITLKLYYPATSAGTETTPDSSGAPYPTIIMMPYAGGDETAYDFIAPRLVSWGFVIVCAGQNQADSTSGDVPDMNDLLDQLERDNATAGHRLSGMVDKGAFGISGHSRGGAYSVTDGCDVQRLRAVQAMAPALSNSSVDGMASRFSKPFQVQVGRLDSSFWAVSLHAYRNFRAPKHALDLANTGHGGPFCWDLAISFFFRYLLGLTEYERFLYGEPAIDEAADTKYFLNYSLPGGAFFPPDLSVASSSLAPDEDSQVRFDLSWAGLLPMGHPRGNFTWDFTSDGATDSRGPYEISANTTFTRSGTTTVTARYVLGGLYLCTNNTLRLEVRNPPPAVTASGDVSASEDEAVALAAFGTDTASDLPYLSYRWDFGDGTAAVAANASHAWKQAGNYTARVTLRDDEGAESCATVTVVVANLAPMATAGADIQADMDSEVEFSGAGADTPSDLAALRYRWDFGDGRSGDWSAEPRAAHTYTSPGRFVAALFVQDGDGASSLSTSNVTVRNVAPTCAVFGPRPGAAVQKDEPLELDGGGADTATDRPRLQYCWDFGDGNSSGWGPSPAVSHTYTKGGNHTAVLSVRDPAGAVATASVRFPVRNQPPTVKITAPAGGDFDEDSLVTLRAEGHDTASDESHLIYSWLVDGKNRPGPAAEAAFTTEGAHGFTVTVTDPEGATAAAAGTVLIGNPAPRLSASLEPAAIMLHEQVRFLASAEDTASDLGALAFSWDFGDGASSAEPSGTHVYRQAGTFIVKVSVRDDEGARDTRTFTVRVDEPAVNPPPGGNGTATKAPLLSAPTAAAVGAAVLLVVAAAILMRRRRRRA